MTLQGHSEPVSALAWSPDGTKLVSAAESTIVLWDLSVSSHSRFLRLAIGTDPLHV